MGSSEKFSPCLERRVFSSFSRHLLRAPIYSALVVVTMAAALCVSSCEAVSNRRPETAAALLTGREVHELQNSTVMDAVGELELGNNRYLIPKAPYVELMEIGRGTSTPYHQAAITLKAVPFADQRPDLPHTPSDVVTALVGFSAPRLAGGFPVPDRMWKRSEHGLTDFPGVDLWLETEDCVDDMPPEPSPKKSNLEIRALWTVDSVPLFLSCYTPLTPTPNRRYTLSCSGSSDLIPPGVIIRFKGLTSLDSGCRAALEALAPSFSYLPMIVADWREE